MHVAIKYIILAVGFLAAVFSFGSTCTNTGAGITGAGAFIAFALIEIQDLKIMNDKNDNQ